MEQPELILPELYTNTGLFADYYLAEKLPQERVWRDALADQKVKEIYDQIEALYNSKKDMLEGANEAQTEDEFIRPVLAYLGFSYIVQTPTKAMGRSQTPDYALFGDDEDKRSGYPEVKQNNYSRALGIADAKYWGRPLDKKMSNSRDTFTNQNPTFQISSYLVSTKVSWAILTNGRIWRLYSRDNSQTMAEYYQVDLVQILESKDLGRFLYFYLLFGKRAFQPDPVECLLDQIVRSSIEYGADLEVNLKKKIFEDIFIYLAKGFYEWRKQKGEETNTDKDLKNIFDNTLILLYRLLFILYAESRDLLPVKERDKYFTRSFTRIKSGIKKDIESSKAMSKVSTEYWDSLVNLFHLIDTGDPNLNIPKYNGGLFSKAHVFLEANKISDFFLVEAIYSLTTYLEPNRSAWVFVDYKSLGVKQLGSIYEGLLEFHLSIAEEELALVIENSREKYVPVVNISKRQRDTGLRVEPGDLYLENIRSERRSTGSYYTPDYIVNYMVNCAIGPLIEDIEAAFCAKVESLINDGDYKDVTSEEMNSEISNYDPALRMLDLKICDPAMGSGHFLVSTVDYISNRIFETLTKYSGQEYFGGQQYESPIYQQINDIRDQILLEMENQGITIDKEKLEDDKVIIRRMVMKRCIFGVDRNYLAVELAKLSLWLDSFTIGAPLSFLDHHLRWGNSLIGSYIKDIQKEMDRSLFGSQFTGLLSATEAMKEIGSLTDSTYSELQASQNDYKRALELLAPYKKMLDIWTSQYFGNNGAKDLIDQGKIDPDHFDECIEEFDEGELDILKVAESIKKDKCFFHWELEFPEAIFDKEGSLQAPQFDVVIGNPPYVRVDSLPSDDKEFYKAMYITPSGKYDLYYIMSEKALGLTSASGIQSFIVPNRFCSNVTGKTLRLLIGKHPAHIEVVSLLPVFPDASVYPIVYVSRRNGKSQLSIYRPETIENIGRENGFDISDKEWNSLPGNVIPIWASKEFVELVSRLYTSASTPLHKILKISEGLRFSRNRIMDRVDRITTTGVVLQYQFSRYSIINPLAQLTNQAAQEISGSTAPRIILSQQPKILFAEDALRFEATLDTSGSIPQGGVYFGTAIDSRYSLSFLLAILNSRMATSIFKQLWGGIHMGGGYLRFRTENIGTIPIRLISFTSREKDRLIECEKAKGLYEDYLCNGEISELRHFVETMMRKDYKPDPELVINHNNNPLNKEWKIPEGSEWEQSDVVHDFLAFLADQMISANEKFNDEVIGFTEYLSRLIGCNLEELENRTVVTAYYKHPLEELFAVLRQNRDKIEQFDPDARSDQERLVKEYQKSLKRLNPLLLKLSATDRLIDEITYILYGLTDSDIEVIES